MPEFLRGCIQRMLKEWFLPQWIILKERTEGKEEQFAHEMHIIQLLRPLQGQCIPRCFGIAIIDDDNPAIVLERIDGQSLDQLPLEQLVNPVLLPELATNAEELNHPHLLQSLRTMYGRLTQYGIVHGDPGLHNFIWSRNGVQAIDSNIPTFCPPM